MENTEKASSVAHEFREVSAGEWRRNLYGYERNMWLLEQRDGIFTIIVAATAHSTSTEELQEAWTALPRTAPVVYTRIVQDSPEQVAQLTYNVPEDPDQALKQWSARTVRVASALSREDLAQLAIGRQAAATAAAIKEDHHAARLYMTSGDDGEVHLVLALLHTVVDGRAAWMILHRLLSLLAKKPLITSADWGQSYVERLPIPMPFLTSIIKPGESPQLDAGEYFSKIRAIEAELAPFACLPETIPPHASSQDEPDTYIGHIAMPSAAYESIHKLAKDKGITATGWISIYVALVAIALNAADSAKTVRFRLAASDGRWRLPQNDSQYLGMAVVFGSIDIADVKGLESILLELQETATLSTLFWDLARKTTEAYRLLKHDEARVAAAEDFAEGLVRAMAAGSGAQFDKSDTRFFSLGKVEDFVQSKYEARHGRMVTLSNFKTFPNMGRRHGVTMHAYQFNGDLHIIWQISRKLNAEGFIATFERTMENVLGLILKAIGAV